jgi:hypothetical protein
MFFPILFALFGHLFAFQHPAHNATSSDITSPRKSRLRLGLYTKESIYTYSPDASSRSSTPVFKK